MALVVLFRGVNVGGHRTFRPARLAEELKHLGAVNIGAAGTLVIRRPISQAELRIELARLPFAASVMICTGREIADLVSRNGFANRRERPGIVRFVSLLAKRPRSNPSLPISFPSAGRWVVKILARDDRLVVGLYRRQMSAISYLGELDRLFKVPATTRSWNTITAIARVLGRG